VIIIPKRREFRVRQNGTEVELVLDGQTIATMPYQAALILSKALHIKAKELEEIVKSDQIVFDQALLTRLGVPFGLTRNRFLLKEATKEAVHNSKLRRYLPGGVKSREVFGSPAIIKH
jgi:hypothetical protein